MLRNPFLTLQQKDMVKSRQPFLHVEDEYNWVDKSLDGKFETEYVKRFGPIFYDFSSTSVKNLIPVFSLYYLFY